MQVETYCSEKQPGFVLVVPTGTEISELKGAAAYVNDSAPWLKQKTGSLKNIFAGDACARIEAQLAVYGASLEQVAA